MSNAQKLSQAVAGGVAAVTTNTTTSADGEISLFSGTGGKTLKRASTTGILKATSGVLSAATAGTDYSAGTNALATGILKSTTTTGALTIATNADLPAMTATVGGAVPTPPNNTTTFLRGDGTFAAAGGGSWIYLSTVSASNSATVDIETTFNSTYDNYVIVANGIVAATDGAVIWARMKVSGAYVGGGADYTYRVSHLTADASTYAAHNSSGAGQALLNDGTDSVAYHPAAFVMHVFDAPSASTNNCAIWAGVCNTGGGVLTHISGAMELTSNQAALQGVRFLMSTGNITAGTFRLYGIKNS